MATKKPRTSKKKAAKKPAQRQVATDEIQPVPKLRELLSDYRAIWRELKAPILTIMFIYAFFWAIMVNKTLPVDIPELKQTLNDVAGLSPSSPSNQAVLLGTVVVSGGFVDGEIEGMYSFVFGLFASLAVIWLLRHRSAGVKLTAKMALYNGMTPIIPVLLLITMVSVMLIPMAVGAYLLGQSIVSGIAVSLIERLFFWLLFFIGSAITMRWLVRALIAFYAVTIPGMGPVQAWRDALDIVDQRRTAIFIRVFSWVLLQLVLFSLVMLIVIALIPDRAVQVSGISVVIFVPVNHIFLYNLYRRLI